MCLLALQALLGWRGHHLCCNIFQSSEKVQTACKHTLAIWRTLDARSLDRKEALEVFITWRSFLMHNAQ